MTIKKFNQAVEKYRFLSTKPEWLSKMSRFNSAAKLLRDIGRNHMTVSAITGYFQTKIYFAKSSFNSVT